MEYRQVQKIAKDTLAYAIHRIKPGMNLREIRRLCEEKCLNWAPTLSGTGMWAHLCLQEMKLRYPFRAGNIRQVTE